MDSKKQYDHRRQPGSPRGRKGIAKTQIGFHSMGITCQLFPSVAPDEDHMVASASTSTATSSSSSQHLR